MKATPGNLLATGPLLLCATRPFLVLGIILGFSWIFVIFPGLFGSKLVKKEPQGRGSYLTKYGPTISHGDPNRAQNTFLDFVDELVVSLGAGCLYRSWVSV